jgi:hypothetical protein
MKPVIDMNKYEQDVLDVAHNQAPDRPVNYAPPATRIETILQEGGQKLKDQIDKIVQEVASSVVKEITAMRKELDDLEAITIRSCDAAKNALGNHLTIAAQSMESCNKMRKQIEEFRGQLDDSMPKNGNTA